MSHPLRTRALARPQRRGGVTDRLRIFRDPSGLWRWERTRHDVPVARSSRGYDRQRTCLYYAARSNRKPYVVVFDGGVDFERWC